MATKQDIERLDRAINEIKNTMATKQDIERLDKEIEETKKIMATKQELEEIKNVMATKEDLKGMATKEDLKTMATKEDLKGMATKEDLKTMATKEDLKGMATKEDLKTMATKEDLKGMATKEDLKTMATKEDLKRLETIITGLGARWGIMNEDSFRQGVGELLSNSGWKVSREVLYDRDGYVYDEPSDVEYDIVIKDGSVILVEITSSLKRGDLPTIKRKKEFYEKVKNIKVNLVYIITPFIHDRYPERVKAMAKDMGIEIIYPSS
nr:PD-(D/E)XK nuclease family protein [Saccharolobus shibatae]